MFMLKDLETGAPKAKVDRMDEILHVSQDKVMRKHAHSAEPNPDVLCRNTGISLKAIQILTPTRSKAPDCTNVSAKWGHTATGLYGWCVADLPNALLDMLAHSTDTH